MKFALLTVTWLLIQLQNALAFSDIPIGQIPVYIALKSPPTQVLRDKLSDLSNPLSVNYGQWMTPMEINSYSRNEKTIIK